MRERHCLSGVAAFGHSYTQDPQSADEFLYGLTTREIPELQKCADGRVRRERTTSSSSRSTTKSLDRANRVREAYWVKTFSKEVTTEGKHAGKNDKPI